MVWLNRGVKPLLQSKKCPGAYSEDLYLDAAQIQTVATITQLRDHNAWRHAGAHPTADLPLGKKTATSLPCP